MRIRFMRRGGFASAMLMVLSISTGCQQPLAVSDAYFTPGQGRGAADGAEARRVIAYHRALQAARRSCAATAPPSAGKRGGPNPGAATGLSALADLCADMRTPSTAARGGTANAYQRWIEDRVRDLPKAAATGAGAAGGT